MEQRRLSTRKVGAYTKKPSSDPKTVRERAFFLLEGVLLDQPHSDALKGCGEPILGAKLLADRKVVLFDLVLTEIQIFPNLVV